MNNFARKFTALSMCILMESFFAAASRAQSYAGPFEEGARLFKTNRPEEAIPLLELALACKDTDPVAYIYLAMSYDQTGRRGEAVDLLKKAMLVPGADRKTIAFNIGNLLFLDENYLDAQQWYSVAIEEDAEFYPPVLNRANSLLRQGKIEESIDDYERFAAACPDDPQAPTIAQLLGLLHEELAAREAAKADAELAAEELILAAMRERERMAVERELQAQMERDMADRLAAEDSALLNAMVGEESGALRPQDTSAIYERLDDTADMARSESVADMGAALRGLESVGDDVDLPRQVAGAPAAQYESVQSEELPQLTATAPAPQYERVDSAEEAAAVAAANARNAAAPRTAADATRGMEQVGAGSVDTPGSLGGLRSGAQPSQAQKVDAADAFSEEKPAEIPQERIADTEAERLNERNKNDEVPSTKVGESDYEQARAFSEEIGGLGQQDE